LYLRFFNKKTSNFSEHFHKKSKFLLNALIKLLCRICRISWFQNTKFKAIIETIASFETCSFDAALTYFTIFNEIIYEFQLTNIPPKNKYIYCYFRYLRLISEFKETILVQIYEFSTKYLLDIFNKNIKFEKNEQMVTFVKEIAKSLISCFEFDEMNVHDRSDKYFIVTSILMNRMFPMFLTEIKSREKRC